MFQPLNKPARELVRLAVVVPMARTTNTGQARVRIAIIVVYMRGLHVDGVLLERPGRNALTSMRHATLDTHPAGGVLARAS